MLRFSTFVVASVAAHAVLMVASSARPRSEQNAVGDSLPVEELEIEQPPETSPPTGPPATAAAPAPSWPAPSATSRVMAPTRTGVRPGAAAQAPDESGLELADDTPRFVIAIGDSANASGRVSSFGVTAFHEVGGDDAPLAERDVDGKARFASGPSPQYPDGARSAGVEGDVRLELIVDSVGAVESARVIRGSGGELDQAALRAARQFHFAPATKAGRPVSVRMPWSMQFRLR